VERFHQYLSSAMYFAADRNPDRWEDHLDTALFAYRTSPIDGLDITPFEVMYGRRPNLPIDNMLFRENYEKPINNLEQYMDYMFDNQQSMFAAVQRERQERFNRNKRNAGEHKVNRSFNVGDKVYLSFPKGRFRPPGGSTKLAHRNDGPYTVLEKIQDGLVYKVQHDAKGFIHNTSVARMMPVADMVMPSNAIDLPLPNRWKQIVERSDRINDIPEHIYKEKQQALQKANNEERKEDISIQENKPQAEEPEEKFSLEEDQEFEPENEGEGSEQLIPKGKKKIDQQIDSQSKSTATTTATREAIVQEQSKRRRQEESPDYARHYTTGPATRAQRRLQRAQRVGQDVASTISWLALAPSASTQANSRTSQKRKQRAAERERRTKQYQSGTATSAKGERDRVTPAVGKELQVRLDAHSRHRVGCAHCTTHQWESLAEPQSPSDSLMQGVGGVSSAQKLFADHSSSIE
jgi:hypothetical protein